MRRGGSLNPASAARDIAPPRRRDVLGLAALALLPGACTRTDPFLFGSTATGVPFSFLDISRERLDGLMIDIAGVVANRAGLAFDFAINSFAGLVPALMAGKIDGIAAAMLKTPERDKVVAFSDPVFRYGGGVVVRADDRAAIRTLADLRPRRIGAQVGTRFVDQVAALGARGLATYDGLSDALRDLANGRIDAVYGDGPVLRHYMAGPNGQALRLAPDFVPPTREEVCLILRRGDRRLAAINAAIAATRGGAITAAVRRRGLA